MRQTVLLVLLASMAGLSLVAYLVWAFDKARAARPGSRRVRERTLLLLALAGGWPGAWAARRRKRHKTRKAGFTLRLGLVTLLHLAGGALLVAASG